MGAWWPTLGFALFAMVGLGVTAGAASIPGKGQAWLTWLAGVFTLAMTLLSGHNARRTWIGESAVPGLVSISPYMAVAAFALVLLGIYLGSLAAAHERVSSVAVVPMIVAAVWMLPLATPHMGPGSAPDALEKVQTSVTAFLSSKTEGWFAEAG